MSQTNRREPPLARLVGRRPNQGAADAAKAVLTDVQNLLRAELNLAKAEITDGVKAKVLGAGFFIVAAVIGWLAIQVFLVFLGFLFALFLPGWAAVGLVLLLLVIAIGVLGFFGYRKLQVEASLRQAKASVAESKRATTAAVDQAKSNTKVGVEQAKVAVAETADEVKVEVRQRIDAKLGRSTTAPSLPATTTPTPMPGVIEESTS